MTITCLRHSKADKTFSDNHRLHPLSEEGVKLAKRRRVSLGNPTFDLVICSPLIRTKQTAQIVADVDEGEVVVVPDLFYEDNSQHGQKLNAMFRKLGHAPLEKYLAEPDGDVMYTVGKLGWKGVQAAIMTGVPDTNKDDAQVLVIGHGMMINMLGIAAGCDPTILRGRILEETQGFSFSEGGRIQKLID